VCQYVCVVRVALPRQGQSSVPGAAARWNDSVQHFGFDNLTCLMGGFLLFNVDQSTTDR